MTSFDDLIPAAFRGVDFHVERASDTAGRRLVTHEYPGRDTPYSEDMGRAARRWTLSGYVVGDDWLDQREQLQRAFNQSGPGLLVHPTEGELTVAVENAVFDFDDREARIIRFTATFVESGQKLQPSSRVNTGAEIEELAEAAKASIIEEFLDSFDVSGLPSFVADSAEEHFAELIEDVESITATANAVGDEADDLAATVEDFSADVRDAQSLAEDTLDLIDKLREATDDPAALLDLVGFGSDFVEVSEVTSTRQRQAQNQAATIALVRRAALVEAARATPSKTFDSRDDAEAFRDSIVAELNSEITTAGDAGERKAWAALSDLKALVVRDINRRSSDLPGVETFELTETKPALVIAYSLYADATRSDEITTRNRVVHSGFVPPQTLEVLAE